MKKSKAIFLPLLALSLMLAGCSEGETEDSGSSTSSQITSSTSSQDLENNEIRRIYNLYLESGGTMTYEQWLATIKGEKGDPGSSILNGISNPDSSVGKNGDVFINTTSWDVFFKNNNTWSKVGNISGPKGDTGEAGPKGDTGATGEQGPKGDNGYTPYIGENGNWWINNQDTGFQAVGQNGANGTNGANGNDGIDGVDGFSLLTGNGGPSSNLGKNGDSYIDLNSWDYYVKTNGIWVTSGNIKGKDADSETDEQGLDFYLLDDGTYGVGIGKAILLSEIHVPEYYHGKPVTKIVDHFGAQQFVKPSSYINRTFYLPKSIKSVGIYPFGNLMCNNLNIYIDQTYEQFININYDHTMLSYIYGDVHFTLKDMEFDFSDWCSLYINVETNHDIDDYFGFSADIRNGSFGYSHSVTSSNPAWSISIQDPSVLSYDEITHEFHALDSGTTNVTFTYQNKSQTVEITVGDNSYIFEMWTGFGRDYTRPIDSMVQDFNYQEENVNIYNVMQGSIDNVLMKVLNFYSQGLIPDIVVAPSDHVAEYFNAGILVPLDSYIERYNDEHMCNILEDYYGECMYLNTNVGYDYDTEDPYITGLPFTQSTEVMLCNGLYFDYFKSLDASIFVPETWAELKDVAPKVLAIVESQNLQDVNNNYIVGKVQKIDGSNHASDFRIIKDEEEIHDDEVFIQDISNLNAEKPFYCLGYDSADNAFITILHQWGVPYTDYSKEDYFNNDQYGHALFWKDANKSATKEALQYFVDIKNESGGFAVPYTFGEISDCSVPFEQGRCLFNVSSSMGLFKYRFFDDELTQRAQRLETHPIPYKDAFQKAVISENLSLCLLNRIGLTHDFTDFDDYNEKMYQAFCALVKLTTGGLQAAWCVSTGSFPASISSTLSPIYQDYLNNENPTRLQKLYRDAGLVNSHEYNAEHSWEKFIDPGFRGSNSIRANVKTVFQQILNSASIDDVMYNAWSRLSPMIKR